MNTNPNELIYTGARRFLGVAEVSGPRSNKLIQAWIKQAATWLDGDDSKTAWCGCFRGAIGLETGTGVPKAYYRALNWLAWGKPVKSLKDAIRGDTVVLKRPGGYHVGLLETFDGARLRLLGGNQGNAVSIATFNPADVVGIRRAS